jgi:hypothetical protein
LLVGSRDGLGLLDERIRIVHGNAIPKTMQYVPVVLLEVVRINMINLITDELSLPLLDPISVPT